MNRESKFNVGEFVVVQQVPRPSCLGVVCEKTSANYYKVFVLGDLEKPKIVYGATAVQEIIQKTYEPYVDVMPRNMCNFPFDQVLALAKVVCDTAWYTEYPWMHMNPLKDYFMSDGGQVLIWADVARHLLHRGSYDDYCVWSMANMTTSEFRAGFQWVWENLHQLFPAVVQTPTCSWEDQLEDPHNLLQRIEEIIHTQLHKSKPKR